MQYKIVGWPAAVGILSSMKMLEEKVNEYLKEGWEPIGGVSISEYGAVFQAMIKK